MEKVTPIIKDGKIRCPKCNMVVENSIRCYGCGSPFNPIPELKEEKIEDGLIEYDELKKYYPDDGTKLKKKEVIKNIDSDIDSTVHKKKVISQTTSVSQEKFKKADDTNYIIASSGQRFANFILDSIFIYIFAILLGALLVIIEMDFILEIYSEFWLGVLIYLTYFLNFEILLKGRTPAKFITQTKAINNDGSKLTFGRAFGRTLCRYIPFEAFSFFGHRPVGWHDSISKTVVISTRKKTILKNEIKKRRGGHANLLRNIIFVPICALIIEVIYFCYVMLLSWVMNLNTTMLVVFLILFGVMGWSLFKGLSGMLMGFASRIATNTKFSFWTVVIISIINCCLALYHYWTQGLDFDTGIIIISVIYTILLIQLTWAIIIGTLLATDE